MRYRPRLNTHLRKYCVDAQINVSTQHTKLMQKPINKHSDTPADSNSRLVAAIPSHSTLRATHAAYLRFCLRFSTSLQTTNLHISRNVSHSRLSTADTSNWNIGTCRVYFSLHSLPISFPCAVSSAGIHFQLYSLQREQLVCTPTTTTTSGCSKRSAERTV